MNPVSALLLYWRTLRHLRLSQLTYRVLRRLPGTQPGTGDPPPLRVRAATLKGWPARTNRFVGQNRIRLIGIERDLDGAALWNDPSVPKLWLYQLHYFDFLTAAQRECTLGARLLTRWISENQVGSGVGWEPYPLSVRVRNWIKWHLKHEALDADALASLAVQVRWLEQRLELHLLGNHLLENAIALKCAAMFFAGPEANRWGKRADGLLGREVTEQIRADGGHFERSPMYQALVLEGLLDLLNIAQAMGVGAPVGLRDVCCRMLHCLEVMSHTDGGISYFNDAAHGVSLEYRQLAAYAGDLGLTRPERRPLPLVLLEDIGFARMEAGPAVLICDVGDVGPKYQPGHAHAGSLSFELSLGRNRFIVNCGTSTYERSPRREYERSTAAHSVLTCDAMNSSEVWHAFRVGRRASVTVTRATGSDGYAELQAAHDGYWRMDLKVIHRRGWRLETCGLVLTDWIEGSMHGLDIEWYLHLSPRVVVLQTARGSYLLQIPGEPLELELVCDPQMLTRMEKDYYCPEFGVREESLQIVGSARLSVPARFETRMRWSNTG